MLCTVWDFCHHAKTEGANAATLVVNHQRYRKVALVNPKLEIAVLTHGGLKASTFRNDYIFARLATRHRRGPNQLVCGFLGLGHTNHDHNGKSRVQHPISWSFERTKNAL